MLALGIDKHTLKVLEFDQVLEILASFAASDLGKAAARALYPSTDPEWINLRLGQTSELKTLLDQGSRVPMAGVHDIRHLIEHFGQKQTLFEPSELIEITDTLAACGRVRDFLDGLDPVRFTTLRTFRERLSSFDKIVEQVDRCIDGRTGIRDSASDKLRTIRRDIKDVEDQIKRRFNQIVSSPDLRNAIENENILIRHGRCVVALKANYRGSLRGTVLDRSNTGATLYVEPDALVEMSNQLEDARFEEKKEIDRILWELTHAIIARDTDVLQSLRTLAGIDLTYAKARFSIEYGLSAPQIGKFMKLWDVRHPLLLKLIADREDRPVADVMHQVVPISPRLGDDFDLLLVTGPNTGGKTVLLKTIGLCVLMAQAGLHIPARSDSQVTIYLHVFADIGDEQSIQQSLSTFSAHMRQIVDILQRANDRTLVLLDELGAGTDPIEGAALATAILEDLLTRASHAVATTHLGQLKAFCFTRARAENASVQFDTETLRPTYRLFIGTPGSSNAVTIARRLGMPEGVLQKTLALLASQSDETSDLLNQVQKSRQLAEHKRLKAEGVLDKARQIKIEASHRKDQIEQEGRRIRNEADLHVDQSLRAVRSLAQVFLQKMQSAPKPWKELAEQLAEQASLLAAGTTLAVRRQQFINGLHRGDSVYVIPFRREATVERVRLNRGTIVVHLEGKQVELSFDDVSRPQARES